MRRLLLCGVIAAFLVAPAVAEAAKPILGVTGNTADFQSETGQGSLVDEAFLGWGQGLSYGVPFQNTFASLAPIPMIHLGTNAKGSLTKAVITPGGIAAGQGDGYLIALNTAIAQWGKAIYVRPMAEMNNDGNLWAGYNANGTPKGPAYSPATYRKAFARIYLIVHGGAVAAINAKLKALGMPGVSGGDLPVNPFPRVRVLWSPLAGGNPQVPGNAPENYYPGNPYVDVGGGDIYDEASGSPPWSELDDLYTFARAHGKPFSVPEWGLFGIDDPTFMQDMCDFLKQHPQTETSEFYESKPGTIFDLDTKPKSRRVYGTCITPQGAALPSWAMNAPGDAKQLALSLTPNPDTGDAPLDVAFGLAAKLSVPIVQWTVAFGDGQQASGSGTPPATLDHVYKANGVYQATLVVYQGPPFTGTAIRFLTTATVTVGTGAEPVVRLKTTPSSGAAPLKVVYQIDTSLPRPVTSWELIYGDGLDHQGTGQPPHFAGHTYTKPGTYQAILILNESSLSPTYTVATITVS